MRMELNAYFGIMIKLKSKNCLESPRHLYLGKRKGRVDETRSTRDQRGWPSDQLRSG